MKQKKQDVFITERYSDHTGSDLWLFLNGLEFVENVCCKVERNCLKSIVDKREKLESYKLLNENHKKQKKSGGQKQEQRIRAVNRNQ